MGLSNKISFLGGNIMTKEQKRSEKYGCDGRCYTPYSMCLGAETCPETKGKEFISTFIAIIASILLESIIPIAAIIGVIWLIFSCIF